MVHGGEPRSGPDVRVQGVMRTQATCPLRRCHPASPRRDDQASRAMQATETSWAFVSEFSPLRLQSGRKKGCHRLTLAPPLERSLGPLHPSCCSATSRGAQASRDISRHPSLPATLTHCVKDEPFAGRGKPGPRLDDVGEILVAAEQHQAGRQALVPDARKRLSQQYLQIQGSGFDSPRPGAS